MPHSKSAIISFVFLACSCASTPAKQPTPPQTVPHPAVAKAVPAEAPLNPGPTSQAETQPKLEPGRYLESFDCVDTVGFPPAGQRWACNEGKCGQAKLPDLNAPDSAATPAEATASDDKIEAKRKKSTSRHQ